MNSFSSTQSSNGLLKNSYGDSGLSDALKKKRQKLAETKLGLERDLDQENQDAIDENAKD